MSERTWRRRKRLRGEGGRILQSGGVGQSHEEFAQRGDAIGRLFVEPRMIESGVPVSDSVAQGDGTSQAMGEITRNCVVGGKHVKCSPCVIRRLPPRIRNPVRCEIDDFLNRQNK